MPKGSKSGFLKDELFLNQVWHHLLPVLGHFQTGSGERVPISETARHLRSACQKVRSQKG